MGSSRHVVAVYEKVKMSMKREKIRSKYLESEPPCSYGVYEVRMQAYLAGAARPVNARGLDPIRPLEILGKPLGVISLPCVIYLLV